MMKRIPKQLALLFLTIGSWPLLSQNLDCSQGRLVDTIFSDISVQTVQFGANVDATGQPVKLMADVYSPTYDEVRDRSLIILAFGGSFISGQRGDMAPLAQLYAKKGHVVASIDYRLYPVFVLGFPDDQAIAETVLGAVHDMRAAVRFFKASVNQGNPFGIDAEKIYLGGISAGSITAIHATYLDDRDSLNSLMQIYLETHGGQEGNSSLDSLDYAYNSHVEGVINLSGAIIDTTFIQAGDPPIFSFQGTDDEVVPFGVGKAGGLLTVYGSGIIHRVADRLGIPNILEAVQGGMHTDIYFEPQFAGQLSQFMVALDEYYVSTLCGATSSLVQLDKGTDLSVFPNPVRNEFTIAGETKVNRVAMVNMQGQPFYLSGSNNHFSIHANVPPGLYLLKFEVGQQWVTKKILRLP